MRQMKSALQRRERKDELQAVYFDGAATRSEADVVFRVNRQQRLIPDSFIHGTHLRDRRHDPCSLKTQPRNQEQEVRRLTSAGPPRVGMRRLLNGLTRPLSKQTRPLCLWEHQRLSGALLFIFLQSRLGLKWREEERLSKFGEKGKKKEGYGQTAAIKVMYETSLSDWLNSSPTKHNRVYVHTQQGVCECVRPRSHTLAHTPSSL